MHLEVVEVSGANQYNVKPLELVSTCVPLIVVLSTVFALALEAGAEAAGLLAPAAGVLAAGEELLEFPHADTARATAASPAAAHIFRIRILSLSMLLTPTGITHPGCTGNPFRPR